MSGDSFCTQCEKQIPDDEFVVHWGSCADCWDAHVAENLCGPTPGPWTAGPVECSICDNRMTFGFASPGMAAAHHETEMVEMMAILTGWSRESGEWICGRHDGQPKGSAQ